jgi:hypothetical protein
VDSGEGTSLFQQEWCRYVDEPTRRTGVATPQLVVLPSRYRYILSPIVDYVLEVERTCPNRQVAVLIPANWSNDTGITTYCTTNERPS